MSISLADLLAPRTRVAIRTQLISDFDSALVAAGKDAASPTWRPGNVLLTTLDLVAIASASFDAIAQTLAKAQSLQLADGELLKALARDVYGVTPIEDTVATGYVDVTAGATGFWITAGVDQFRNPLSKVLYTAHETVFVPSNSTVSVPVMGSKLGIEEDSGPNTVTEMVITRVGATCTNTASIQGILGESEVQLRERASLAPIGRQPQSTLAKWIYEITNVAVHTVPVTRYRVFRTGCTINVIAATSAGALSVSEEAALSNHLQATVLGDSGGFVLTSTSVVAVALSVITLWAKTSDRRTDAEIQSEADAICARVCSECPIGGYALGSFLGLPSDRFTHALIQGLDLIDVDNVPADTVLASNEVPVSNDISFMIRRVNA